MSSNDSYVTSSDDSVSSGNRDDSVASGNRDMQDDGMDGPVDLSSAWIMERILVLKDSGLKEVFGSFDWSNKAFEDNVVHCFMDIRKNNAPDDYQSITRNVVELINKDCFLKSFSMLRGIYEFIIQMHNEYDVKIDVTMTEEKDRVLRETMENVMSKLTICFQNFAGIALTIF